MQVLRIKRVIRVGFALAIISLLFQGCNQYYFFNDSVIWNAEKAIIDGEELSYKDSQIFLPATATFHKKTIIIEKYNGGHKQLQFEFKVISKTTNYFSVDLTNLESKKKYSTKFFYDDMLNGIDKNSCQELHIVGDSFNLYLWRCYDGKFYLDKKRDIVIK